MTNVRTFWTPDTSLVQRCTTPQGQGHIWPYTPLEVQVARGRMCVVLDGCTTGARYYTVGEVEIEGSER